MPQSKRRQCQTFSGCFDSGTFTREVAEGSAEVFVNADLSEAWGAVVGSRSGLQMVVDVDGCST